MAKSTKKVTNNVLAMPRSTSTTRSTIPTSIDIATRAFALYCERGCQHGHDVEDWLKAERELHDRAKSPAAQSAIAAASATRSELGERAGANA